MEKVRTTGEGEREREKEEEVETNGDRQRDGEIERCRRISLKFLGDSIFMKLLRPGKYPAEAAEQSKVHISVSQSGSTS